MCAMCRTIVESSSRLRVRIFFAENNPTRAATLECLSHLPIVVDWKDGIWMRFISAPRYPNSERVCRITIRGPHEFFDNPKSAGFAFPCARALEIHNICSMKPNPLAASLITSIQSLRHLCLVNVDLKFLLPSLSAARALVDLTLGVDAVHYEMQGASLLARMPHLCNFQVSTRCHSTPEKNFPTCLAQLTELTYFPLL
jgi:hypothetical protein